MLVNSSLRLKKGYKPNISLAWQLTEIYNYQNNQFEAVACSQDIIPAGLIA